MTYDRNTPARGVSPETQRLARRIQELLVEEPNWPPMSDEVIERVAVILGPVFGAPPQSF